MRLNRESNETVTVRPQCLYHHNILSKEHTGTLNNETV